MEPPIDTPNPDWRSRIRVDAAVHHGEPCIAGTRVAVSVIVGSIADGDSFEQVLAAYPALAREDIAAALNYAAEAVRGYKSLPLRHAS